MGGFGYNIYQVARRINMLSVLAEKIKPKIYEYGFLEE
jgi:hypothetical protein